MDGKQKCSTINVLKLTLLQYSLLANCSTFTILQYFNLASSPYDVSFGFVSTTGYNCKQYQPGGGLSCI